MEYYARKRTTSIYRAVQRESIVVFHYVELSIVRRKSLWSLT